MVLLKKQILSFKKRLRVYKLALLHVENMNCLSFHMAPGHKQLCFLLPCIWMNKTSWNEPFIDAIGKKFHYSATQYYFPEFGKCYFDGSYQTFNFNHQMVVSDEAMEICMARHEWRIKILKKIIAEMEAQLLKP